MTDRTKRLSKIGSVCHVPNMTEIFKVDEQYFTQALKLLSYVQLLIDIQTCFRNRFDYLDQTRSRSVFADDGLNQH